MIYLSGNKYKDLSSALLRCDPYGTVVFLGFEIKLLYYRDGSRFYRVCCPGFASIDLHNISDVFSTVLRLYDYEHPMYQPEFDF